MEDKIFNEVGIVLKEESSGGISTVATDATLTGNGSVGNPLHVVGGGGTYAEVTDPTPLYISQAILDANVGIKIQLDDAANTQIIGVPSTSDKVFDVVNLATSTFSLTLTAGLDTNILEPGHGIRYFWDGSTWDTLEGVDASHITFTPFSGITSTNVQDAVKEVADERVPYTGATTDVDLGAHRELIGSTANFTDFPNAKSIASAGNTGHTYTGDIGLIGEAISNGTDTSTGVGGVANTNGIYGGRGVSGVGKVTNGADSGNSIGVFGRALDAHAGGNNIGVFSNASGGLKNYSFYGFAGEIYNQGLILSDSTVEGTDMLVTGLGVDSWWANTTKSVSSFLTTMSTYIKTMLGDGKMATGIPYAEWPKFSVTVADTTMNISINLNGGYTSWNYYIKGQKFTQTGALTKTGLTPAAGFWFVYISSANVFTVSQLPWSISGGDVMLFSFIWDSAAATPTADNTISDERHNMGIDVFNHASEHAVGAKWESGMLPVLMNGIAQDQTTLNALTESYLRAQLQVTNGVFWDEDLKIAITHAGAPVYDWNFNFKQFLGFSEAAVATTNATQITFTTTRTVVAGQRFTCMSGSSTTTVRGSGTFTVGGTGTIFATSSVTNMAAGDTIVVGAKIPIWYRATNGGTAFGNWRKIAATDVPCHLITNVAQYNTVAGITPVTNQRFFNMWIVATNNTTEPIICIMGQTQSTNTNLATFLASTLADISSLSLGSLPWAEFCPLMRLTYEYDSGFNASYRVRLRDVTNLRLRVSTINFGNITSGNHTALSNRSDANSHPASAISFDVGVTGISQGDIQTMLDYYFAPQRTLTSAGTITSADNVVVFIGGAAITQALPACSTMSKKPITFKNISATNSVTFTPNGTDLMDETILLPLSTFTFLGVYNTTDSLWHWTL